MAGSFVRNSLVNAFASACVTLGGFLSSIVVARVLGVQGTGVVAYAAWAVTVAIIVADVGIPGTLSRFLPEVRAREGDGAAAGLTRMLLHPFLLSTGVIGALFLGYAIGLFWFHSLPDPWSVSPETFQISPLFWGLIALSCTGQSLAAFASGYLKGMQRFADFARLALLSSVVQIGGTAAGAFLFGSGGALAGVALGATIPAWALFLAGTEGATPPAGLRRRVVRYTLETWAGYILWSFFASRMEVFFLERSWGSHAVGLFTVSLTLSNLATQGPLLLTGTLVPQLAFHLGRGEHDIARALYPTSLRLMCLMVFPACFGMAAIAPALLPAIYGASFAEAVPSATILVAGAALVAGSSVVGAYMNAAERNRFGLLLGVGGAILSVAAGFTAIPFFGPVAAAWSRVGIQTAIAGATLFYAYRQLDCRVPIRDIGGIGLAALLCAVTARLIVSFEPGIGGMLAGIAAGAIIYIVALRFLSPLPARDVERLRSALAALPPRLRPAARMGLLFILRA